MDQTVKPQISVIIAAYNAGESIVSCLQSLEAQVTDKCFEIIVVDSSTDHTAELVERIFPSVRLYRFSERKYCGDARNVGIAAAKAEVVAFLDADCRAERNWIEEVFKAHQLPYPAVGGAIANGASHRLVGWAAYFCEFSQWMPNSPEAWKDDVAGANMSYKRRVFEELGSFIEGTYCSDTQFHWRVKKSGRRIRFTPSILVYHDSIDHFLNFISHEYYHGRSFARVRVTAKKFSKYRKFVYTVLFPLITAKLFLKIVIGNFKNTIYLGEFLKASFLVMLGIIAWSIGECTGYMDSRHMEPTVL
jgi:GT2 family glycosyltransferase